MRRASFVYASLLIVLNLWSAVCVAQSPIETGFNKLHDADSANFSAPYGKRVSLLSNIYTREFSKYFSSEESVRRMGNEDVKILFRAASLMAFYQSSKTYRNDMRVALEVMDARGIAAEQDFKDMFGELLKDREFAEARTFRRKHPSLHLPRVPEFRDRTASETQGPTALNIDDEKFQLVRTSLDISHGAHVIVIGHPKCQFCQAAIRDISKDPDFAEVFFLHSRWLAPPERELNIDAFQQWNRNHPHVKMEMIYSRDEWPGFAIGATPTFYFLRDGKVVGKVSGWPKEGHLKELKSGFKQLGLYQ